MTVVHPSTLVRISSSLLNKYINLYNDIGKVAWRVMLEVYRKGELIGRTFNGTTRRTMISPRKKNAIVKAIEDIVKAPNVKIAK